MYLEFTKDYLSYPKGRIMTMPEANGSVLMSKGVVKEVQKEAFEKYEKKRFEIEQKCKDCQEKGKDCEECGGGKDAKRVTLPVDQ